MKFLLTLVFALLGTSLMAQGSDYIIDINDMKIMGTLKLNTPAINSSQIKFKANGKEVFEKYRPDEIKEWGTGGGLIYESKVYAISEQKGFSAFMLRLTPPGGKVQLYEFYNTQGDVGYTQTFLERDRGLTEVEFGRFRKQMAAYFKDHEELAKDITNKKYKKKDLLTIIEVYNEWREFLWR